MGSSLRTLRLSCFTACGILAPRPGIEPTTPALQGQFLTTGPPGKSQKVWILMLTWSRIFFFWQEQNSQYHQVKCAEYPALEIGTSASYV